MKKILLTVLAITLIGGVSFALSQSQWLKGEFGLPDDDLDFDRDIPGGLIGMTEDMDPTGEAEWEEEADPEEDGAPMGEGSEYISRDLPTGGGISDDETYHIMVSVKDSNQTDITGLTADNFSAVDGTTITSVEEEGSATYNLTMSAEGTYNIKVSKDGYIPGYGLSCQTAGSGDDVWIGCSIELPYSHVITVKNQDGTEMADATVKAGSTPFTLETCIEYETGTYGCALPASASIKNQYTVNKTNYDPASGTFAYTYTSADIVPVTVEVTLTETEVETDTDTDGDGLLDSEEEENGTDPSDSDSDDDGLNDGAEMESFGSDPLDPDTDGGSVPDGEEVTNGTNPLDAEDDVEETYENTCNNLNLSPDSYELDADETTMPSIELTVTLSGARTQVSFWEKIWDYVLVSVMLADESSWTDTLILESSGSGTFTDEDGNQGSPLTIEFSGDSVSLTVTYSNGTVGDIIKAYISGEESTCYDALTLTQATSAIPETDTDNDGLSDDTETKLGTDQNDSDTDDDNLTDYEEVYTYSTDPLNNDSDNDSLKDGKEIKTYETDPLDDDSDNGGIEDGEEISNRTDPNDGSDDYETDDDSKELDLDGLDSEEDCEENYSDVEDDDWFAETVCRLTEAGYVKGRTQYNSHSLFYPNDEITKAEVMKLISMILLDLDETDAKGKSTGFTDISTNDWHYPWVVNAEAEDVLRTRDWGTTGNFGEEVSRGELTVYIARALGLTSYSYKITYKDVDTDDWFAYAIALLSRTDDEYVKDMAYDGSDEELPVVEGYDNGTFKPYDKINRAEALTMIYRAYQIYLAD